MSLVVEDRSGARWLRLDAPETFNALTGEVTLALTAALREVVDDDTLRCVVITGTGGAFSAGADLSGPDPQDNYDGRAVDAAAQLIAAALECDRPVVCGLNGVAAGVGLSLAVSADVIVATRSASLTLAFGRIGLMPDGGATATVAAAVGRVRAMRLALLSEVLSADEAQDCGLISYVFDDQEYAAGLDKIVGRLCKGAPLAQAATKKAINAATLGGLSQAFGREHSGQSALLRTEDVREGMAAFVQKRHPDFRGQ